MRRAAAGIKVREDDRRWGRGKWGEGGQDRRGQEGKWGEHGQGQARKWAGTSLCPYYTAARDVPRASIRWVSIVGAEACPCPPSVATCYVAVATCTMRSASLSNSSRNAC